MWFVWLYGPLMWDILMTRSMEVAGSEELSTISKSLLHWLWLLYQKVWTPIYLSVKRKKSLLLQVEKYSFVFKMWQGKQNGLYIALAWTIKPTTWTMKLHWIQHSFLCLITACCVFAQVFQQSSLPAWHWAPGGWPGKMRLFAAYRQWRHWVAPLLYAQTKQEH